MPSENILFVPAFTRKKNVSAKFNPNTYRVLIGDAEHWENRDPLPLLKVPDHLSKRYPIPETNFAPRVTSDLRHNNPQPWHCSFLRTNVRTLNDPICHVGTYDVKNQQPEWWRTDLQPIERPNPQHTDDSTFRADYKSWSYRNRNTRHSSNPNVTAANGIVPVNSLPERDGSIPIWQEGLSYEHMYDSRTKNNYPPRAKRHGAFVYQQNGRRRLEELPKSATALVPQDSSPVRETAPVSAHPVPTWRPPGLAPFHRQYIRRDRSSEDTVATLIQPDFSAPLKTDFTG